MHVPLICLPLLGFAIGPLGCGSDSVKPTGFYVRAVGEKGLLSDQVTQGSLRVGEPTAAADQPIWAASRRVTCARGVCEASFDRLPPAELGTDFTLVLEDAHGRVAGAGSVSMAVEQRASEDGAWEPRRLDSYAGASATAHYLLHQWSGGDMLIYSDTLKKILGDVGSPVDSAGQVPAWRRFGAEYAASRNDAEPGVTTIQLVERSLKALGSAQRLRSTGASNACGTVGKGALGGGGTEVNRVEGRTLKLAVPMAQIGTLPDAVAIGKLMSALFGHRSGVAQELGVIAKDLQTMSLCMSQMNSEISQITSDVFANGRRLDAISGTLATDHFDIQDKAWTARASSVANAFHGLYAFLVNNQPRVTAAEVESGDAPGIATLNGLNEVILDKCGSGGAQDFLEEIACQNMIRELLPFLGDASLSQAYDNIQYLSGLYDAEPSSAAASLARGAEALFRDACFQGVSSCTVSWDDLSTYNTRQAARVSHALLAFQAFYTLYQVALGAEPVLGVYPRAVYAGVDDCSHETDRYACETARQTQAVLEKFGPSMASDSNHLLDHAPQGAWRGEGQCSFEKLVRAMDTSTDPPTVASDKFYALCAPLEEGGSETKDTLAIPLAWCSEPAQSGVSGAKSQAPKPISKKVWVNPQGALVCDDWDWPNALPDASQIGGGEYYNYCTYLPDAIEMSTMPIPAAGESPMRDCGKRAVMGVGVHSANTAGFRMLFSNRRVLFLVGHATRFIPDGFSLGVSGGKGDPLVSNLATGFGASLGLRTSAWSTQDPAPCIGGFTDQLRNPEHTYRGTIYAGKVVEHPSGLPSCERVEE